MFTLPGIGDFFRRALFSYEQLLNAVCLACHRD